ncbi:putative immunogenic protein NIP-3 [Ditylenchus destructor]|uniref:Immunogenic protein NIP-3 n=1 Tax=Ditylenchus destructor TaxID=166010 RepID=A0AAD4RAG4_9BILA|nr:putative immunogenic protein NIP-3 [Ditylenchus destructor]
MPKSRSPERKLRFILAINFSRRQRKRNVFKRIQVFIPSIKQKTERVSFEGPEEKKVMISGENCLGKKWVVRTWKPDGKGDWVGAKQESAKIDGMGWMRIIVDDNLLPRIHDRMAIFCSEGELCG